MVLEAVKGFNARLVEAYNRGDVAAVAALYTEDATVLPPNSQAIRGRQAVHDFWNGARLVGLRDLALETTSVEQSGDTAYEVGAYSLHVRPQGGQPVSDRGKYVVIWKRQADGSWKLAVDIWNTDSPMA